eukprot:13409610-Alexandrium_andersonii.AAC.1
MFRALRWSFLALTTGTYPDSRHDGQEWQPSDETRASLAGLDMDLQAVIIHIKGDWSEFAHTLAFPSWASAEYPCMFCSADRESLYSVASFSHKNFGYHLTTPEDYEEACA